MRGRKPREMNLDANDRSILEQVARSRTLPHFSTLHTMKTGLDVIAF
jgi:hypothetical protein